MDALQYIYTSWKNGNSTEKGYMIYSHSEGISNAECNAIKDAMQYLTPKELPFTPTPQEIAEVFPFAFSYFILPTGRGCVAQSTYLGKDYSGRYGNYIIYALVFNINDLPCRPAELFAEPYIKTAMTDEELNAPSPVPPLPPLNISDYAAVINDEQLSEFLFDKEDKFAKVISMILASQDSGIPFYLNDSRENLVLWSAAVQRMLPPKIAKKFTFNTYVGDHEFMRSSRAKEEGLNFHLIGVRPDANYFNYATECRSNRQNVIDFINGYITEGIATNSYSQAMASSMAFDYDEVDCFGSFIESTSFNDINSHLQDAYLYYNLLQNDEIDFTEEALKAILSFGDKYCSESDNSSIGSKLLIKYQEEGWTVQPDSLVLFWIFICKYSSFMIFTLYDIFTETIYQHAGESSEPCVKLVSVLNKIKIEYPHQYKDYLNYLNSPSCVDHLVLYLCGQSNPYTNNFYITWLLESYTFAGGLSSNQPITKLLVTILKNITHTPKSERQMIELLLLTADNQALFEDILHIFISALNAPDKLDQFCFSFAEISKSLPQSQLNQFEHLLLENPENAPIATRLYAKEIALSNNPKDEFWRFYDSQRTRLISNSSFSIAPLILACLQSLDDKAREEFAIDILKKVDNALLNDYEANKALTNVINDCSIKNLAKMDIGFLQRVCQIRNKVDETGLEKIKAVYVGKLLEISVSNRKPNVSLSYDISKAGITLNSFDRTDYDTYIKSYLRDYIIHIQIGDDISTLMKIFYNDRYFASFVDSFTSALKKLQRKDTSKWKSIISWTCVYLVTAESFDQIAQELYKPIIRYLRTLDEGDLLTVRQALIQNIPSTRCDYLFDEVHRKEDLSEKIGRFFHRK